MVGRRRDRVGRSPSLAGLGVLLLTPGCGSDEPVARLVARAEPASLVFVGDVMFDRAVAGDFAARGLAPGAALDPTREHVSAADFAAFNLETTVSDERSPLDKRYTFDSDASLLTALADAGFDLANLANNHVLDFGAAGLADTRAHLAEAGLDTCGIAGIDAPQVPFVTERAGLTFGLLGYADPEAPTAYAPEFLAFDPRPARADLALVARDLAALRPRVDVVVVQVHWGVELEPVTERQRSLGRFMIDHGADLVVGHHPHVVEPAEWYGRGLILYSLGHFLCEFPADPAQMTSALVRVTVDQRGVRDAERLELALRPQEWIPRPVTGTFERIR